MSAIGCLYERLGDKEPMLYWNDGRRAVRLGDRAEVECRVPGTARRDRALGTIESVAYGPDACIEIVGVRRDGEPEREELWGCDFRAYDPELGYGFDDACHDDCEVS